jgi:hypothetical protein
MTTLKIINQTLTHYALIKMLPQLFFSGKEIPTFFSASLD